MSQDKDSQRRLTQFFVTPQEEQYLRKQLEICQWLDLAPESAEDPDFVEVKDEWPITSKPRISVILPTESNEDNPLAEVFDRFADDWRYCRTQYAKGDDKLIQLHQLGLQLLDLDGNELEYVNIEIGAGQDLADVFDEDGLLEKIEDHKTFTVTDAVLESATDRDDGYLTVRVKWQIRTACPSSSKGCQGFWISDGFCDIDVEVNL